MNLVSIMGMEYEKGSEPDFGSIRMSKNDPYEYILKSEDVQKLNLLTKVPDGATAFCIDSTDLYMKHDSMWVKVGS